MKAPTHWVSLLGGSLRDPDLARQAVKAGRQVIWSEDRAVGLRRDLSVPHVGVEAQVDITVRPLRAEDVPHLFDVKEAMTPGEKWDRLYRSRLLRSGSGTCFVAATDGDVPCYMQWSFDHHDNEFVQNYFGGAFPVLDEDTVLLEGAYTPTAFRGKRIMSAAMALIASRAQSAGARSVVTFVGVDNIPSIKGCERAGFQIYAERCRRWRVLRSSVQFTPR